MPLYGSNSLDNPSLGVWGLLHIQCGSREKWLLSAGRWLAGTSVEVLNISECGVRGWRGDFGLERMVRRMVRVGAGEAGVQGV